MVVAFLSVKAQKFGKTPEDSVSCRQNLSMYQEAYKNKNYQAAIEPWSNVLKLCPGFSVGTYQRGEFMLQTLIGKETDVVKKQGLIDALLAMYDIQIEYFGDNGAILAKKGSALFQYNPKEIVAAVEMMEEGIASAGADVDPYTEYYYYRANFYLLKYGKITKGDLIDLYMPIMSRLDGYGEKYPQQSATVTWAKSNVEGLFVKVAKCEDIIDVAKKNVTASPDNLELKKSYVELLLNKECKGDGFVLNLIESVCDVEPSLDCYVNLAKGYKDAGDYNKSSSYIEKAISECGDCDKLNDYKAVAVTVFTQSKKYSQAKKYASDLNKMGDVYLLTALQIANKANDCGDNPFEKKAAYWLAYDYAAKAKATDANLTTQANSLMAAYKSRFPNKGEVFDYYDLNKATYNVSCWNNESTSVRVAQ